MDLSTFRKEWSTRHKELRTLLTENTDHEKAIQLFITQHAVLHTAHVTPDIDWSYADFILDDLTDDQFRRAPKNQEHSIVWCIWHLARIEDLTMNILLAGRPQLLHTEGWYQKMKASAQDTGNEMSHADMLKLSEEMDVQALRAYRAAVGSRTQEIVRTLQPEILNLKTDPARIQQLLDEQAVVPAAQGVLDYWGSRTMAGLLLMPPSRHNLVHLNEAYDLKGRRT